MLPVVAAGGAAAGGGALAAGGSTALAAGGASAAGAGGFAAGARALGGATASGARNASSMAGSFGNISNLMGKINGNLGLMGKIIDDIIAGVKKVSNAWIEIQDTAFKAGRTMAMSREEAMKFDRTLMQETKEFGRAYGTSAKEIAAYQQAYSQATGRNIRLTKEQTEQMLALGNVTDTATANKLAAEFDKIGVSLEDTLAYTGEIQEKAKYLGLNGVKASKSLAENLKLASRYSFKNGVDDIERMVLKSQSMKMNMESVMTAMDNFSTLEGAINTSANIQMLGGSFAQQFANPMAVAYESMADPAAFQDRLANLVKGKGTYDEKTNQVKFDPVTMMQLKQVSKQLGISVDELTNPAIAEKQNNAVEREAAGKGWSDAQMQAIKDLSRTNFDEKTGKHYVSWVDERGETQRTNVEDLTPEQLKVAQDSQMTEEQMYKDLHAIKEHIVGKTMERSRTTRSFRENTQGFKESFKSWMAQIANIWMPTASGFWGGGNGAVGNAAGSLTNGVGGNSAYSGIITGKDGILGGFAHGGIVHASDGAYVGGDEYVGDNVPAMVNSGEMIINQNQQSGLWDFIKTLGTVGASAFIGNKIGNKFGVKNLGTQSAIMSTFTGQDMMSSMLTMGMMQKMGIGGLFGGFKGGNGASPLNTGGIVPESRQLPSNTITDLVEGVDYFEIVDGIDDAKDAVKDLTKNNSKLSKVTSKMSGKFGRLGRMAGSIGGKFKTLGTKLTGLFGKASKWLKGSKVTSIAKSALTYGKQGVKSLVGYGSKGINMVKDSKTFTKLTNSFSKIGGTFEKVGKSTGGLGKMVGSLGKFGGSTIGKIGKGIGKKIPGLGIALGAVDAISGISNASSKFDATKAEIENSNMSETEKKKAMDEATDEKRGDIGKAVGSGIGMAAGTAIGATLGSAIPVVGTAIGGIVGGFVGEKIGGAIGGLTKQVSKFSRGVKNFLFGSEDDDKAKFSEEELNDPDLERKAYSSVIKIYELMLKKNSGGLVGKLGRGIGSLITAPASIAVGAATSAFKGIKKVAGGVKDFIFGKKDNKSKASATSFSDEELNDPKLAQKADASIIKIYELLEGKFGKKSDKNEGGAISTVGKGIKSAIALSPFGLVANGAKSLWEKLKGRSILSRKDSDTKHGASSATRAKNQGKGILSSNGIETQYDSVSTIGMKQLGVSSGKIEKPSIKSIPSIGANKTEFKGSSQTERPINIEPKDINLNISGTIKLETPTGQRSELDMRKVMDSAEFKRLLGEMIVQRMNEMANAGKSGKESMQTNMQSLFNGIH